MNNVDNAIGLTPAWIEMDVLENHILARCDLSRLCVLSETCKVWQTLTEDLLCFAKFLETSGIKFLKKEWERLPGVKNVGVEPELTVEVMKILKAKLFEECPFFNQRDPIQAHRFQNNEIKKTWQTRKLILFPKTINEKPRTVDLVGEIFHFVKKGNHKTGFDWIAGNENSEYRTKPAPKSFIALVMMDVAPGSRGVSFQDKETLLNEKGYRVLTPNDAVTSIMIMNLGPSETKEGYYFGRDEKNDGSWWTYTATTEPWENGHLDVGGAARSGLLVRSNYGSRRDGGAAGLLEVLQS